MANIVTIPATTIVIPTSAYIGVVVDSGKLALRALAKSLPNASFEEKVGEVTLCAHGDATRHKLFSSFVAWVRKSIEEHSPASESKAEVEQEWCHYHKAAVGHTIDSCPDVECRKCHAKGHTGRVCKAVP